MIQRVAGRNSVVTAIAVAGALVAPLALLELVNQPAARVDFPVALFIGLSIVPVLFVLLAIPALRDVRAEGLTARPVSLLWRGAAMALLGLAWVSVLRDQLPCFLGVPNCD